MFLQNTVTVLRIVRIVVIGQIIIFLRLCRKPQEIFMFRLNHLPGLPRTSQRKKLVMPPLPFV